MRNTWLAAAVLVVLTVAAFAGVRRNGFVLYDDRKYVTNNPHVRAGLTAGGVVWAFTTGRASNWHPLTWISHMTDETVFDGHPAGHHLVSLLLHAASVVVLFLWLQRATGALGRSAFVAALFGVHPLHVESVAWVAERKDALSTLFWFLAILSYVRWIETREPGRRAAVVVLAAAGLLAKPMLVTLPLTLLLLDVWPLGRLPLGSPRATVLRAWPLIVEKWPLIALSLASTVVTFLVQRAGGAVGSLERYPPGLRAANAVVAYVAYLRKMLWPSDLAVFYPYPAGGVPAARVLGGLAVLVAVTAIAFGARYRRPYLLVGWLWFLGTLVPVIGLVQVGIQSMADRYTYVPLVGIFIAAAWGLTEIAERAGAPAGGRSTRWLYVPALVLVLLLDTRTRAQVRTWRDSESLFRNAVAVTESNGESHLDLGIALVESGRVEEAIAEYREAIRLQPASARALGRLGVALGRLGQNDEARARFEDALRADPRLGEVRTQFAQFLLVVGALDEAAEQFEAAIRLQPGEPAPQAGLGTVRLRQGRTEDARASFERALALDPYSAEAHLGLGRLAERRNDLPEALAQFREATRLDPSDTNARAALEAALARPSPPGRLDLTPLETQAHPGSAEGLNEAGVDLARSGRIDDAIDDFHRAVAMRPDFQRAHLNLGRALAAKGRHEDAAAAYREALTLDPRDPEAHSDLGVSLAALGRTDEALTHYEQALKLRPDYPEALNNLGSALTGLDRAAEALPHLRRAIALRPEYAKAHYNLAVALYATQSYDDARKEVETARSLGLTPPQRFVDMLSAKR